MLTLLSRSDAIKHIDEKFIQAFVAHVRETAQNADVFSVGEFWKGEILNDITRAIANSTCSDSIDSLTGYLDRFDEQFSIFVRLIHLFFLFRAILTLFVTGYSSPLQLR